MVSKETKRKMGILKNRIRESTRFRNWDTADIREIRASSTTPERHNYELQRKLRSRGGWNKALKSDKAKLKRLEAKGEKG